MKILYGVQGTGNGHIGRARVMAQAFSRAGAKVDFLLSGRAKDQYFSMEAFGDYQTRRGLTFHTQQGKVSQWQTLRQNNSLQLWQDIKQLDLSGYDVLLNDFEPVTAWAARRQGLMSIGISHQNAFRYAVPKIQCNWLDEKIMQYFAPTQQHIGLHWHHYQQPILPPIVAVNDKAHYQTSAMPANASHYLVYLPFESLEDIRALLSQAPAQSFICYHPQVQQAHQLDNMQFQPLSFKAFQADLHSCSGVVANGGFELPSEAMTMGKKLLLKPLQGQFEQHSNVTTLLQLGLASEMRQLDGAKLTAWLAQPAAEKVHFPDVAGALVDWVLSGNWQDSRSLTQLREQLWQQVRYPAYATLPV
ncbi:MJ1255/VC2487 family glycosyltransferase [Arsukibacterium sp.]|uniref:MJ1255/VC2487 family glycosyltransferase n=1 Tax=Arsukibacterium sp. TaxID=1977258 RepID=UPI002FDA167B